MSIQRNAENFEAVDHWLQVIKDWEVKSNEEVPDDILQALEHALEKALLSYRVKNSQNMSQMYY